MEQMIRDISPPPTKRRKTTRNVVHAVAAQSFPQALPTASPDVIRIYSWNINGIDPFLQQPITNFFSKAKHLNLENNGAPQTGASLRLFLQRHLWPELLFLQEVKIASRDEKTQNAVRSAVNTPTSAEDRSVSGKGPSYEVHFVLPTDKQNARGLGGSGKVYGVCSIIRTDLVVTHNVAVAAETINWDNEGRVSCIKLQPSSKSERGLAIFNIYAVNGTENPYRDPKSGTIIGTRHDRKLEFHRLLMEESLRLEREGYNIVMAGDFNVAPDARDGYPKLRTWPQQHCVNRADFLAKYLRRPREEVEDVDSSIHSSWQGVDVWREAHMDERRYTYYPRTRSWGTTCDRVDYILTSKTLWDCGKVLVSGILDSEAERGPSDHVPVYASINISTNHATSSNTCNTDTNTMRGQ
ncbi:DNase I-like protein [Aaosphaeria arxii CBS 175.79]|uniref:DNase I-like protein n=1 Tax=Aaosphaeria arxii CBS 175.79 TaxID=1450172 RepID=A0A6A5XCR0_9PLEO|nr:DNase I-like protein [Aaosphaeria arxii CBS 175.79]KAF2010596.1 DNase I-like protein [Aaosphaeria arxii CBS 175.79]